MKTKVVNISKLSRWWITDDKYVYIGRAGKGLSGIFGNPFKLNEESDRTKVLEQYREYLYKKIKEDPEFCEKVKSLYGKTLVCFCKPKGCHGDILAKAAEQLHNGKVPIIDLISPEKQKALKQRAKEFKEREDEA